MLRVMPVTFFDGLRARHRAGHGGAAVRRIRERALRAMRYRTLTDGPPDFDVDATGSLRMTNDGSLISRYLFWLGASGYEPAVAEQWACCCARARGILEIGCNIGYMTVRGAASGGVNVPYTAVEPNPEALRSLRANLALNGLDHVRVVPSAVLGRVTEATAKLQVSMIDSYTAPAGAHLASFGAADVKERVVDVPLTPIADLLDGVDTLKLDVEGAELDILSAVRDRLADQSVTLFVEVLDSAPELRRFLADFAGDHGYRVFVAAESLLEIAPADLPKTPLWKAYQSRDLILVPPDRSQGREAMGPPS